MTVLYLDKAQAANLICERFDLRLSPEQREELMNVLTGVVRSKERELDEAARLRDQLSAALVEATAYLEQRAEELRAR